jgi:hypothetical protein
MNDEATELHVERDPKAWLRKLAEEFLRLEPLFPISAIFPEAEGPQWVQNVERELGAQMFPIAKVKDHFSLTPRRLGALIGHSCAYGVWMVECLEAMMEAPETTDDFSTKTPGEIERCEKFVSGIAFAWYPALRRLAKRALCSSVNQSYEEMTEFLLAYSQAFSRKPKGNGISGFGNSATEIYIILILYWRSVNAMESVRQLHQFLGKIVRSNRIGDLKRVEKICERIELRYRKPGRPKKVKEIPTPK